MLSLSEILYRHPLHKENFRRWALLDAMVRGGGAMTDDFKREILRNPDNAPQSSYEERIKLATYDSVIGGIVMKLASQILIDQATYEGLKGQVWSDFFRSGGLAFDPTDQTITELGFHGVLMRSLVESLTTGSAIAQIAEIEKGKPIVTFRNRASLWDWEKSGKEFSYAKIHDFSQERKTFGGGHQSVHRFTIFWAEEGLNYSSVYTVRSKEAEKHPILSIEDLCSMDEKTLIVEAETEKLEIFSTVQGLSRFPVVSLTLPSQLVLADGLFDLQKSYSNHVMGGEWALLQTNFAQLVFTGIEDPHEEGNKNKAKAKTAGEGHFWELEEGQDAKWLVRPPEGIELTISYQDTLRSRMLEHVHTVAESAASFASKYQSGDSKREQRRSLDVLLEVYGQCVRDFCRGILDVAAIVTNSDQEWTVKGFTDYQTEDLLIWLEDYLKLEEAGIDSPTLKRESQKAIAAKAVEKLNIDPSVLAQIEQEISIEPFNLNESQRDTLVRMGQYGLLQSADLLSTLKQAGDFPASFDVASAVRRAENQSIRVDLPGESILSTNEQFNAPPITEPED